MAAMIVGLGSPPIRVAIPHAGALVKRPKLKCVLPSAWLSVLIAGSAVEPRRQLARIIMQLSPPTPVIAAVSPVLLAATIDHLAALRPAADVVAPAAMRFAIRLNGDADNARALGARITAAQRLFHGPFGTHRRRMGDYLAPEDRLEYHAVIIGFIATAPLDAAQGFVPHALIEALLRRLPALGHA